MSGGERAGGHAGGRVGREGMVERVEELCGRTEEGEEARVDSVESMFGLLCVLIEDECSSLLPLC